MTNASDNPRISAFYGYKGGAGRSLLAANVAATLAKLDNKVLLIDWDLEAPGIGDFFDILPSEKVPERWRNTPGVLDLMAECAHSRTVAGLRRVIGRYIGQHIVSVQLPDRKHQLHLLGPGTQRIQDYAGSLMLSDWTSFFETNGVEFRDAFRQEIATHGYTTIIDTRTGINLPSMFILRFLADKVFFVTPMTSQSLEGAYWMSKVLQQIGPAPDEPLAPIELVLSRHQEDDPDAMALAHTLFPNITDFYEFPHLLEMSDHEQLIFANRRLSNLVLQRRAEDASPESSAAYVQRVERYWKSFERLCKAISRKDLSTEEMRKSSGELAEEFAEHVDPQKEPDLEDGRKLIDASVLEYLKRAEKPRELQLLPPENSDEPQKLATENELLEWISKAHFLKRTTLGLYAAKRFQAHEDLYIRFRGKLRLEWQDGKGAGKLGAGDTRQGVQGPSGGTDVKRSNRNWNLAIALRDDDDDPSEALERFGPPKIATNNDEALQVYERAITLSVLDRRISAIQEMQSNLEQADIPETRGGNRNKLIRADMHRLSVQYGFEELELRAMTAEDAEGVPINALIQAADYLERRGASGLREEEMIGNQYAIYRLRLGMITAGITDIAQKHDDYQAAINCVKKMAQESDQLVRLARGDNRRDSLVSQISIASASHGLLAILERDNIPPGTLFELLHEGRKEVSRWLSTGSNPNSAADDVLNLANVYHDCGKPKDALELCYDALQIIGGKKDIRSELHRVKIIKNIGLLEASLGRPDSAVLTWNALIKTLPADKFPKGSRREQARYGLDWWPDAARILLGELDVASQNLHQHLERYRAFVQDTVISPERYSARQQVVQIEAWLPRLALAQGDYDEVERLIIPVVQRYQRSSFQDMGAPFNIAGSRHVWAQAAYCMGRNDQALDLIEYGKRENEGVAQTFGSKYSQLQNLFLITEAEVRAFGANTPDQVSLQQLNRAVTGVFLSEGNIREAESRGWYYSQRVTAATAAAVAAAVALRAGAPNEAREYVMRVYDQGLLFRVDGSYWDGPDETEAWLTRVSRVSLAVAQAVEYALDRESGISREKKSAEIVNQLRALPEGDKKRYGRIFEYCGLAARSKLV